MRTVWQQPAYTAAMWAGRGVDTLYGFDPGPSHTDSMDQWRSAADAAGLGYIHQAGADPVKDLYYKGFRGWCLPDEPDNNASQTPTAMQALAKSLKAISPSTPICVNFSGNNFRNNNSLIQQYAQTLAGLVNYVGVNWYEIQGWGLPVFPTNGMPTLGAVSDQLAGMFPGVPQQYFVECSNQHLPWIPLNQQRELTPDEFSAEVSMLRARPIVQAWGIFPQSYPAGGGQFQYDGLSSKLLPRIVQELKRP